jgi:hypothetical protein
MNDDDVAPFPSDHDVNGPLGSNDHPHRRSTFYSLATAPETVQTVASRTPPILTLTDVESLCHMYELVSCEEAQRVARADITSTKNTNSEVVDANGAAIFRSGAVGDGAVMVGTLGGSILTTNGGNADAGADDDAAFEELNALTSTLTNNTTIRCTTLRRQPPVIRLTAAGKFLRAGVVRGCGKK